MVTKSGHLLSIKSSFRIPRSLRIPEIVPCDQCDKRQIGSWKKMTEAIYNGDPFSMRVNNYLQTPAITDIQVLANGFTITQIQDYKAWQENAAGSIAHWSSGSINDEVEVARFDYTAKAPSGIIGQTIQNIDVTGNDGTTTLRVTVKEDLTGPLFLLTLPFDGSYFREGILNQQVSAEVEDPETGVERFVRAEEEQDATPEA